MLYCFPRLTMIRAGVLFAAATVIGQTPAHTSSTRTTWGRPDLQGPGRMPPSPLSNGLPR